MEKVKVHENLSLWRNKTREITEQAQKNSKDSENNEIRDLPITDNMMDVINNLKARKRKTYVGVVKAPQTQPLVLKNISSHVNEKDGENQFDLEEIESFLIKNKKLTSSKIATSPPKAINNTSIVSNSSNSFSKLGEFETFDKQDHELLNILEELGNVEKAKEDDVNVTSLDRLRGHFCFDTIFNRSHRVLSNADIKVLEKG